MRKRLLGWAASIAGWTLVGVFFASQSYVVYVQNGSAPIFRNLLIFSLCNWASWALFAPPVAWLARRFPFQRGRMWRSLAVHAGCATAVVLAKLWLDARLRGLAFSRQGRFAPGDFHSSLLTYSAIVAAVQGLALYRKSRERELRASQLESRLAQARLQVLERQLQPHFLFNTLHAISALVHKDPAAADRMISQLGDLLRLALRSEGRQEVSLREEIEFLQRYLEIEKTRFRDRLAVELQVDPAVLGARLPSLVLQPLVENAIRHGIVPRAAPGRIVVRAVRDDGELLVEVSDDGLGLRGPLREGVGLGNARARLEQLYGPGERLTVAPQPAGGVRVTLRVPYGEAE